MLHESRDNGERDALRLILRDCLFCCHGNNMRGPNISLFAAKNLHVCKVLSEGKAAITDNLLSKTADLRWRMVYNF
jgi:hypothetical protein